MQGLSYRQVSRILEISHTRAETVQKIAEAIYRPKILAVRKRRNFIAVEKTIIKINGRKKWLHEVMPGLS
ncbi:Mobile element protein [Thermococcus sp. 2319x1]|nr:Mobile element protein [Thermococcus sp. 2319x1]